MAPFASKRRLDRSVIDARDVAALSEASGGFSGRSAASRRPQPALTAPQPWGFTSTLAAFFLIAVGAYYSLNLFGGPEFDYLEIPLPGVPHTQPGWKPPAKPESTALPKHRPSELFQRPQKEDHVQQAAFTSPVAGSAVTPVAGDADIGMADSASPSEFFPVYTSDELGQVFVAAQNATGCANCNSTGYVVKTVVTSGDDSSGAVVELEGERRVVCPVCRGRPNFRLNQQVYENLCRLAQTLTFVQFELDDVQLNAQKQAIGNLFLHAAGERSRLENLGRLSGLWLARSNRTEAGILLAGTVQEVEEQGPYWATRMMLFGMPREVTVLSAARVPWTPRQRVLVAGSIVDDPAGKLPGYAGKETQVVWGGLPLRLPDEPR